LKLARRYSSRFYLLSRCSHQLDSRIKRIFWSAVLLLRLLTAETHENHARLSPVKALKTKSGVRFATANRSRGGPPHSKARCARKTPSPLPDSPFRLLPIVSSPIRGCRLLPGGFKRAVFRGPLPDKWREFHFAADRVWRLEFSLKHQGSRVAADISERKFHRAGKRHRVLIA